jgi:hypothetical protein
MEPRLRRRTVTLGLACVLVAMTLVIATARVGSAPAGTRRPAPIWLDTAQVTQAGRSLTVFGGIDVKADLEGAVVKLYRRDAGRNADVLVGKATVSHNLMGGNVFSPKLPHLTRNCIITAAWGGNSRCAGSRTWMFAGVAPKLTVSALSVDRRAMVTRLRVEIVPAQPLHRQGRTRPTFLADVQCRIDGVWTSFPTELGGASTDGTSWCVYDYVGAPAGRYTVRAHFKGTNYNAAAFSKPVDIVVP